MYKTLSRPMIIYGYEIWILKKSNKRRIASVEMNFTREMARITFRDKVKSEIITLGLGVTLITKKIKCYRKR